MSRIYVTHLNYEVRKNIKNRKYPLDEVKRIKVNVEELFNMRKKRFKLVFSIFSVLAIALLGLSVAEGTPIVFVFKIIPYFLIPMLILWLIGAGLLKYEYNSAIKKGYPENIDDLRL